MRLSSEFNSNFSRISNSFRDTDAQSYKMTCISNPPLFGVATATFGGTRYYFGMKGNPQKLEDGATVW